MLFDDNALLDKMLNDRKGSKVFVRGRKEFFLRKIKIIYELLINKPFRVAAKTALNWAYRRELGPRLGVPTIPVNDLFNWNDLEINYSNVVSSQFSSTWITEEGTGYDVEECGSGNELDRHIQTGKGNLSSC